VTLGQDAPARQVGERIRRLRLASGLSQSELADRTAITQASISAAENGRSRLDSDDLLKLAVKLKCRVEFLTRYDDDQPVSTRPWLRAYSDAPKRAVDQQRSASELLIGSIDRLGLRTLPDIVPIESIDPNDEEAIEALALDARRLADIDDDAVVGNATRAVERLGCIVTPMHEELGRHLGLSLRIDQTPVICVSRPSHDSDRHVPGDRQRLTVLHELGHLALHSGYPPPETSAEAAALERQAHRFAGAFLVPADALRSEIGAAGGRVTLRTLGRIKERWGVSIKALVVRCDQLGLLSSKDQTRSLYKQISARGWNKNEPYTTGNEEAVWLRTALSKWAGTADRRSAAQQAAETTGLDPSHFERWMDWTPTAAVGSVTVMEPRQNGKLARDATSDGEAGEVLLLTRRE